MHPAIVGLFVGLLLGITLVIDGFGSMLIVALLGAVGWLVGKVLEGEIDLTEYLSGSRARQRRQ
jgi:hypothetical protein